LLELVETNAKHSFEQRFRILKPSAEAIKTALQDALGLETPPRRIECFDISHLQGTDKVASMVVWEDGRMKKSDYRKFIIKSVDGNDDFASMREVVTRRYLRLQQEHAPLPSLVIVDGGIGQLHAAAEALAAIGLASQPLASIAKREEIIYVYGQEDEPVVLDRYSPVTFHRQRRSSARLTSELTRVPGIGPKTVTKLLREIGSLEDVRNATEEELARAVGAAAARKLRAHFAAQP
jgi:excinuclease ABC subunit C